MLHFYGGGARRGGARGALFRSVRRLHLFKRWQGCIDIRGICFVSTLSFLSFYRLRDSLRYSGLGLVLAIESNEIKVQMIFVLLRNVLTVAAYVAQHRALRS